MTPDEQARATFAYMDAHRDEWAAWNARPIGERDAIHAKVEATAAAHGILAARQMMRALGMPMIPDDLCEPVEVLEAKARNGQGDDDMRDLARLMGMSEAEIDAMLEPDAQGVRLDH